MKCPKCESEKGFRGEQEVEVLTGERADGTFGITDTIPKEPERVYCKKCGTLVEVRTEEHELKLKLLAEKMAEEFLDGEGAPKSLTEDDRRKLASDIRASMPDRVLLHPPAHLEEPGDKPQE